MINKAPEGLWKGWKTLLYILSSAFKPYRYITQNTVKIPKKLAYFFNKLDSLLIGKFLSCYKGTSLF